LVWAAWAWAVWGAAHACLNVALGYGAADVRIDMAAAMTLAAADGCAPEVASTLLRQVQQGLSAAKAARKEGSTT
jgi:hypothetical protein